MKILFIFTGGTIGSTLHGDVISPDSEKSYKIIEEYRRRFGVAFEYSTRSPYTELSENNTGEHIRSLCSCIKEAVREEWDGIIVTHGTDTLAYSSAAIGYSTGVGSIPVCIVSSNRPIEHVRANGIDNLHAAVRFILERRGRGAFVVYRNDGERNVAVHRATRLLGPKAYSDEVSSVCDSQYGYYDSEFKYVQNTEYRECDDATEVLLTEKTKDVCSEVCVIHAYPGMIYPTLTDDIRCVIINTYHSGTVDTKSERAANFYLDAKQRGIIVYAAGVMGGPDYESAERFSELGIIEAKNISPVALYVKTWVLLSSGKSPLSCIDLSISGDIMP